MNGEKKPMISWEEIIRTMDEGLELADQVWTHNLPSVLPRINVLLKIKGQIEEYINFWAFYKSHQLAKKYRQKKTKRKKGLSSKPGLRGAEYTK